MTDTLRSGQQLNINDKLIPENGKTTLILQSDGNLVLYRNDNSKALWSSNTWDKPVNHAVMQGDGNFVCYDASGYAFWATGTWNHPGSYIVLQDDGNLCLYSPNNNLLWQSGTSQNWHPMTTDTGDVSVGTGNHMQSSASINSAGLISGHTHTWCTVDLRGFHGSVLPVLLGADGKAVWPSDPDGNKHTYGVDGVWVGTHDRTDYWTNQVDAGVLAKAKSFTCINYYDPHNMLLADIPIILQTAEEIAAAIKAIAG